LFRLPIFLSSYLPSFIDFSLSLGNGKGSGGDRSEAEEQLLAYHIEDNNTGSYNIYYKILKDSILGENYLAVLMNNEHIIGSPFRIKVAREKNKLTFGNNITFNEDWSKATATRDGGWCRIMNSLTLNRQISFQIIPSTEKHFCAIRIFDSPSASFDVGSANEGLFCWNLFNDCFYSQQKQIYTGNTNSFKKPGESLYKISLLLVNHGIECYYNNNFIYTLKMKILTDQLPLFIYVCHYHIGSIVELLKQ
jgi:hypothetical protein